MRIVTFLAQPSSALDADSPVLSSPLPVFVYPLLLWPVASSALLPQPLAIVPAVLEVELEAD